MEPASENLVESTEKQGKLKVGIVTDDDMILHRSQHNHPERPERQIAIISRLKDQNLLSQCDYVDKLQEVDDSIITPIHPQKYIEYVNNIVTNSDDLTYTLSGSTYYNKYTDMAARKAIMGAKLLTDNVLSGKWDNGFGVLRPPGHHAGVNGQIEGFCIYNTVAVAARYAIESHKIKRVLIFDWDVHHGDSTQKVLYNDPNILFISLHRYDDGCFYPLLSGSMSNKGEGEGEGFNINIPWNLDKNLSPTAGDSEYIYVYERILHPIIKSFAPELVFVSAGFDSARGDPFGGLDVTPDGYAYLLKRLQAIQPKIVVCLEGGYNIESIAVSAEACIRALLGETLPLKGADKPFTLEELKEAAVPYAMGIQTANDAVKEFAKYWPAITQKEYLEYEENVLKLFKNKEIMCAGDPRHLIFTSEKVLKKSSLFEKSAYESIFAGKDVPEKFLSLSPYLPKYYGVERVNETEYIVLENVAKGEAKYSALKIKIYRSRSVKELNAIVSGYFVRNSKAEIVEKHSQRGKYPKTITVSYDNLENIIDLVAKEPKENGSQSYQEAKGTSVSEMRKVCANCVSAVQEFLLFDPQIGSLSVLIIAVDGAITKVSVIDIESK